MIEDDVRAEDSRAIELALALDRVGTHEDLSKRLKRLPGTDNEGLLLATIAQAEAILELKAAEQVTVPPVIAQDEDPIEPEEVEPETEEEDVAADEKESPELESEVEFIPDPGKLYRWIDGEWQEVVTDDVSAEPSPS